MGKRDVSCGQFKGLASSERRVEAVEAILGAWHLHLFWCSLNTCQSWAVMAGTGISFACSLSQWGGAGSLPQSRWDWQLPRLEAAGQAALLSPCLARPLLSVTPLWGEMGLALLGSLILAGSVLAVDKSLIAVDVLLMQALSVVGDGVCDYPVHT